jgi:hypothetical protein
MAACRRDGGGMFNNVEQTGERSSNMKMTNRNGVA